MRYADEPHEDYMVLTLVCSEHMMTEAEIMFTVSLLLQMALTA